MGKKMYQCYVAFTNNENRLIFVTAIDYSTKEFWYTQGEPALKFSESQAKDLVYGMVCNGYPAFVVKAPTYLEFSNIVIANKEGDNDEENNNE